MKKQDKKCGMYLNFIDLEKVNNMINRETLWQVLRMYDVRVKCWVELRVCMLIVQLVMVKGG